MTPNLPFSFKAGLWISQNLLFFANLKIFKHIICNFQNWVQYWTLLHLLIVILKLVLTVYAILRHSISSCPDQNLWMIITLIDLTETKYA